MELSSPTGDGMTLHPDATDCRKPRVDSEDLKVVNWQTDGCPAAKQHVRYAPGTPWVVIHPHTAKLYISPIKDDPV